MKSYKKDEQGNTRHVDLNTKIHDYVNPIIPKFNKKRNMTLKKQQKLQLPLSLAFSTLRFHCIFSEHFVGRVPDNSQVVKMWHTIYQIS